MTEHTRPSFLGPGRGTFVDDGRALEVTFPLVEVKRLERFVMTSADVDPSGYFLTIRLEQTGTREDGQS